MCVPFIVITNPNSGFESLNSLSSEVIKDWLVKPLRDQHVKPKAQATFKGELFKDTPNWKWYKGEKELTPSDKVDITKDGKNVTLTIKNCQPDDVSDYTVEVEDRRYTAKLTLGGWCILQHRSRKKSSRFKQLNVCFQSGKLRS